jgi:HEAT repeat protein
VEIPSCNSIRIRTRGPSDILACVPRTPQLEDVLAALHATRDDPTSEGSLREIRKALEHRSSYVVAKAAQIIGECEISVLTPELVPAFDRFLADSGKDKGCCAKAAIAQALYQLGHDEPAVFLRGIRHVQMEPVFGGKVDTAVDLRGSCALGLVRIGYRDALVELSQLLADREPPVRISAARAIAYRGSEDGAPLLRLKALMGDREAQVTAECLGALLKIAPAQSLEFVSSFLDSPDGAVAEGAALALGASRLSDAFELLRVWTERLRSSDLRRVALVALATLRREEAFDYLLSRVRTESVAIASEAIAALAIYKDSDPIRSRTAAAAVSREDVAIAHAFERAFGTRATP